MENNGNPQLDLFSETTRTTPEDTRRRTGSFIGYLFNYERIILIGIGLLIVGTISFSVGVEKGRRMASQNGDIAVKTEVQTSTRQSAALTQQQERIPAQTATTPLPIQTATTPTVTLVRYTIQLASYVTEGAAQKEAERLKRQGYSTLVLKKGKYTILCVGEFNSREQAQSFLNVFKKQKAYRDCFIRRL
jgi:hypothetical protein